MPSPSVSSGCSGFGPSSSTSKMSSPSSSRSWKSGMPSSSVSSRPSTPSGRPLLSLSVSRKSGDAVAVAVDRRRREIGVAGLAVVGDAVAVAVVVEVVRRAVAVGVDAVRAALVDVGDAVAVGVAVAGGVVVTAARHRRAASERRPRSANRRPQLHGPRTLPSSVPARRTFDERSRDVTARHSAGRWGQRRPAAPRLSSSG